MVSSLGIEEIAFEDLREELLAELERTAAPLRQQGFEVETEVREGDPATVIIELATERDADLIAMGTRGRTGLPHILLGSVAERVVQHAACPVLTVRRTEQG